VLFRSLPAAVWFVVFLAVLDGRSPARHTALIASTVITAAALVFVVVSSQFSAVTFGWAVARWSALLLVLVLALRKRIPAGWLHMRELFSSTREWGRWEWLTATIVGFFAVGTLLGGLLYPFMNSDSLAYHMPRVFFWYQNQSVRHFMTPEGRQIFSGPFAEYLILVTKVLSGGSSVFSKTVQWFAYIVAIIAASLIAMRLGAGRRGQQVAAVVTASTPMAILQASTTQNDLVWSAWSLAAVYWIVTYIDRGPEGRRETAAWVLLLSSSIGFAILTKAPAYFVCAPFLLWLVVVAVRRDGLRRAAALGGAVFLLVVAVNAGWFLENARVLGWDIIGIRAPGGNTGVLVRDFHPSPLLTNALKNSSMMLSTPFDSVNESVARGVRVLIRSYGGDPENHRTKDRNMRHSYRLDHRISYHDIGPSPIISLLATISVGVVLVSRRPGLRLSRWYVLCAGCVLLLTAGLIGYNHHINRILLGPLLLFAPLVGVATGVLLGNHRRIGRPLVLGLFGLAVCWGAMVMLFNSTNRLIPPSLTPVRIGSRDLGWWNTPRQDLTYRAHLPQLEKPYEDIAEIVRRKRYTRIGIDSKALNVSIHPLLELLEGREVRYVGHTLLKGKLVRKRYFSPDAVLAITPADEPGWTREDASWGTVIYGPVSGLGVTLTLYETPVTSHLERAEP